MCIYIYIYTYMNWTVILLSTGSQRVRQDMVTEEQQHI